MKSYSLIYFLILLFLSGCNKPDPAAYLQDPIYQDFQAELSKANAASVEAAAQIKQYEEDLKKAVPQTGQQHFPKKWLAGAVEAKTKSDQMVKYWELKIKSRKKEAQSEYLRAFRDKKAWPDPAVFDQYNKSKLAQQRSRTWDSKSRVKDFRSTLPQDARPTNNNADSPAGGAPSEH
jgi:hypothetical protein